MKTNTEIKDQKITINKIMKYINDFKKDAYDKINKIWKSVGYKPDPYSSIDLIDIYVMLMFGESKYDNNITKKIDFNKNKNLIKNSILSMGFDNAITIIKETIKICDDFIYEITREIISITNEKKRNNTDDVLLTTDELNRLNDFIFGLYGLSEHSYSSINTVNVLYRNIEKYSLKDIKRDSLKRYYFNHVYNLKNNVKIFDKEHMFFGETNNIMALFDKAYDFVFGDFINIYNTLDNIFKPLVR